MKKRSLETQTLRDGCR